MILEKNKKDVHDDDGAGSAFTGTPVPILPARQLQK
jgi:hypothetical protein